MDDDRSVGAVDDTDFEQFSGGVGANENRQAVMR